LSLSVIPKQQSDPHAVSETHMYLAGDKASIRKVLYEKVEM
jgi:hypothetical protein